ncbi:MAG TPA: 6-phosphofructokinase [Dehalococcoidales bacterium]|nr:6-phosphofructokinase [Dehalococcoidales bacterium]
MKRLNKRIGVLTGGGDCPGINAAITWVVKTATECEIETGCKYNCEVLGTKDGWKGLTFNPDNQAQYVLPLTEELVRPWDRHGGTNLGTSRHNPYNPEKYTANLVIKNSGPIGEVVGKLNKVHVANMYDTVRDYGSSSILYRLSETNI